MKKWSFLLLVLAGCGNQPLSSEDTSGVAVDEEGKDDRWCVRRGRRCTVGGTRCCTGYCNDVGYGWGYCRAPLAEGESCTEDAQCAAGLFCDNEGYAYWQCTRPRADGEFCTAEKQCATGRCIEYVCGGPRCSSLGGSCSSDGECCQGRCELYRVYSPDYHTCLALLADGEFCQRDLECTSGRCAGSRCVSATCGNSCAADADCCAGFYCSTWTSYGPTWDCAPQGDFGARCFSNSMCLSGHCTNGSCQ